MAIGEEYAQATISNTTKDRLNGAHLIDNKRISFDTLD